MRTFYSLLFLSVISLSASSLNISRNAPTQYKTITKGQSLTFSVDISDPYGLSNTQWYIGSNLQANHSLSGYYQNDQWSHTFNTSGTYQISIYAYNVNGDEEFIWWMVTVNNPTFPDLIVINQSVSPTTDVVAGSSVSTSCRVKNQGTGSAGSSTLKYYLSTNTTYGSSDIFLDSDGVSSLSSGTYSSESESIVIPSNTADGNYYILFVADASNAVNESNENNNVSYVQIEVEEPIGSVAITDPNGGETWYCGSTHNITWNVSGNITALDLQYTTDNGNNWTPLPAPSSINGPLSWTIPNGINSSQCKVKVLGYYGSQMDYDISNSAFTIIPGTVTMVTPNGGETWHEGSTYNVSWNVTGNIDGIDIQYTTDNGNTWTALPPPASINGPLSWTIPSGISSTQCKMKVIGYYNSQIADIDLSNSTFTIDELPIGSVTLTSPNGGETWYCGSTHDITWNVSGNITALDLQYTTDGGNSWTALPAPSSINGPFSWTIPSGINSNQCEVKVLGYYGSQTVYDKSNSTFTMTPGTVTMASPNGGETWYEGNTYDISWNVTGVIDGIDIQYTTNNGNSWTALPPPASINGPLSWTIPSGISSTQCKMKVIGYYNSLIADIDLSNNTFTIDELPIGSVTLTSPNGGETWFSGSTHDITWNVSGNISALDLQYTTDDGNSWTALPAPSSINGPFSWTIPNGINSSQCKVKVLGYYGSQMDYDVCNTSFSILPQASGSVTMLSPNGGESWSGGNTYSITWDVSGNIDAIDIQYTTDNGNSWTALPPPSTINGPLSWTVPFGINSTQCKMKVIGYYNSQIASLDKSDGLFAISDLAQSTIQFSGMTWDVRSGTGNPGSNNWLASPVNIWTDTQGQLHLKTKYIGSTWYCSEVNTQESFGYGEYKFKIISDVESFDKNIVLGLFSYLNDSAEIDIEFSKWGNALNSFVGNYVVQSSQPGQPSTYHVFDPNMSPGFYSTHRFVWLEDTIFFDSWHGHADEPQSGTQMSSWKYYGPDIPIPSTEKVLLNLWHHEGNPPSNGLETEVIISDVEIDTTGVAEFMVYDHGNAAEDAFISIYSNNGAYSASDITDQSGYAFFDLRAHKYFYDVYNQQTANDERELWAYGMLDVSPIKQESRLVERECPNVDQLYVELGNTQTYLNIADMLSLNTDYTFHVVVQNDFVWPASLPTRCKVIFDTDKVAPYDIETSYISHTLSPGVNQTYSYDFTVPASITASNLYFKIIIESELSTGNWTQTEHIAFDDLAAFTLNQNTSLPTVTDVLPVENAINIPVDFPYVRVTFDTPIDPATVTNQTFFLLDGNSNPVSGTINQSTTYNFDFIPSAQLIPNTTYTCSLTNGIQDFSGNPLDGNGNGVSENPDNYSYAFTTNSDPNQSAYVENFIDQFVWLANRDPGNDLNALYTQNKKRYFYISGSLIDIAGLKIYIDLADYAGISIEGQGTCSSFDERVTVYVDGYFNVGVGLPVGLGLTPPIPFADPSVQNPSVRDPKRDFLNINAISGSIPFMQLTSFSYETQNEYATIELHTDPVLELGASMAGASRNLVRFELDKDVLDQIVNNIITSTYLPLSINSSLGSLPNLLINALARTEDTWKVWPKVSSFGSGISKFTVQDDCTIANKDGIICHVRGGYDIDNDGIPDNLYPRVVNTLLGVPTHIAGSFVTIQNTGNQPNDYVIDVDAPLGWYFFADDGVGTGSPFSVNVDTKYNIDELQPHDWNNGVYSAMFGVYADANAPDTAVITFNLRRDNHIPFIDGTLYSSVSDTFYKIDLSNNIAPTINLISPSVNTTVSQNDDLSISWVDFDPDDNAIIGICLDSDLGSNPWNSQNSTKTMITNGFSILEDNDNGSADEFIWQISNVSSGTYSIWASITDGKEISYSKAPGSVTITQSNTMPQVVFNSDQGLWYKDNPTFDIDFTDLSGIDKVWYQIGSNDNSSSSNWTSLSSDGVNILGESTNCTSQNLTLDWKIFDTDWNNLPATGVAGHYIYFKLENDNGNTYISQDQTEAFHFRKDIFPPNVSIDYPANQQTITASNVTVSFTINDNFSGIELSGVDKIYIKIDGQNYIELEEGEDSYEFSGLSNGQHTVSVYAKDLVGNTPPAVSHTFIINPAINPPTAFNLLLPANNSTSNINPTLSWEASSDPDGTNITYTLTYSENSNFTNAIVVNNIPINSHSLSNLDFSKSYYWKVKAIDGNGDFTLSNQNYFRFTTEDDPTQNNPVLSFVGVNGYISDGVDPDTAFENDTIVFQIVYSDSDNQAPFGGFPKLHIYNGGAPISGSPFSMVEYNQASFLSGRPYTYSTKLNPGNFYSYKFECFDINGLQASGETNMMNGPVVLQQPNQMESIFSSNRIWATVDDTVQYYNQSVGNPTSWNWYFEGGSPANSVLQNPYVTYHTAGTYNVQLIVTNGIEADTLLIEDYINVVNPTPLFTCGDLIEDVDGNTYSTVSIGSQCWMAENLRVGAMTNLANNQQDNGIIEKYCYYNDTNYCNSYGGLYQWTEMMDYTNTSGAQGICPDGWHVPTDSEWCAMTSLLDPNVDCNTWTWSGLSIGDKLKKAGSSHWNSSNLSATNSSGFSAVGNGYRTASGANSLLRTGSFLWTSTIYSTDQGINRFLRAEYSTIRRDNYSQTLGFAVRCLRDTIAISQLESNLNDQQEICEGDDVSFTPFVLGGSPPYTYNWSTGQTTQSITVSPSLTTQYFLTVTDNVGTSVIDTTVVLVHPIPIVVAGNDVTICAGSSTTLHASGADTYEWNTGQFSSSITVSPTYTTVYTVTGTTAAGCTASASVEVTIASYPSVDAGPDQTILQGNTAFLTASVSGGSGSFAYYWIPGGMTTASISVSPATTTTYTVEVTDLLSGCLSSDIVTVNVDSSSSPTPLIQEISKQCNQAVISVSGTGTIYTQYKNYLNSTWIPIGSGNAGGQFTLLNLTGGGQYQVRAYQEFSSVPPGSVPPSDWDTILVSLPFCCNQNVFDSTVFNPDPACEGDSVSYSLHWMTNGVDQYDISHIRQGNVFRVDFDRYRSNPDSGGTTIQVLYPTQVDLELGALVQGTYYVNVYSGGAYCFKDTLIVSNCGCPPPLAQFSMQTNSLCVNFTNLSQAAPGAAYFWTFGDGDTSIAQNPVHCYSDSGDYDVCLVVIDSCSIDTFCMQLNVTSTVSPTSLEIASPGISCVSDTVSIPVVISNVTDLGSISLNIAFDDSTLQYIENIENPMLTSGGGVLVDTSNGDQIKISWFSLQSIDFIHDTLFTLRFLVTKEGYSDITWMNPNSDTCMLGSSSSNLILTDFIDGGVTTIICNGSIQGIITYDNAFSTIMTDAFAELYSQSTPWNATDNVDLSGGYDFDQLITDDYLLSGGSNAPGGGWNSNDALLVLKHTVGLDQLTGLSLCAADVTGEGAINATDALNIAKRFVNLINSFPAGDWCFEEHSISLLAGQYHSQNIQALCKGDVNGSYTPAKSAISLHQQKDVTTVAVSQGKAFSIPVIAQSNMTISAASLVMNWPQELSLEDVSFVASDQAALYNIVDNSLRIAWYSLEELAFQPGDTLAMIEARVDQEIQHVSFEITSESQVYDPRAKRLEHAWISIPALVSGSQESWMNIAPVPSRGSVEICYSAKESSNECTIEIYDINGQKKLSRSLYDCEAGINTYLLSAGSLPAGTYIVRLSTAKELHIARMILL